MTDHRLLIVPAAVREAVNAALEADGRGPDNFSVPLVTKTSDSKEPTHYCCAVPGYMAEEFEPHVAAVLAKANQGKPAQERVAKVERADTLDGGFAERVLAEAGMRLVEVQERV